MARNRNFVNQGTRLPLQGLDGYYHAPIEPLDLKKSFPDYKNLPLKELKKLIEKNWIQNFKNEDGEQINFYQEKGHHFFFRDGKSDVYTKGGLDFEVFEYLERQMDESQKWRIETNETYLDFESGGVVFIGGRRFLILKSLTIVTSGTGPNKFLAMKTPENWYKYSIKLLAIV